MKNLFLFLLLFFSFFTTAHASHPLEQLNTMCSNLPFADVKFGLWEINLDGLADEEFKSLLKKYVIISKINPNQGIFNTYFSNTPDFQDYTHVEASWFKQSGHDIVISRFQVPESQDFYDLMVGFVNNEPRTYGFKNWDSDFYYKIKGSKYIGCP